MTEPPDGEAVLEAFLAASAEPGAGLELLAMLHPEALVPFAGALERADHIDPVRYVAAREEAAGDGGAARPRFVAFRVGSRWEDGDDVLLCGSAREADDGREVTLVAGLRRDAGSLRIGWVGLAPPGDLVPRPWTVAQGALLRAGVLAEAVSGPELGAETWLERAYRRQFRHPRPPLLLEPGARFACHGTGACCRNPLNITLPASAQALVDAMPWEAIAPHLVGTRLQPRPDGKLELKKADEACRFLDPAGHCRIHLALGRPVFEPCTVFPFSFARTPDGVVVTATSGCSSVRGGLGPLLEERTDDLHERLYLVQRVHGADTFCVRQGQRVSWEHFQAAEARVLAALRGPGLVVNRLIAAARVLEGDLPPAEPPDDQVRAVLGGMLAALTDGLAAPGVVTARLTHADLREGEAVAAILQRLIFAKKVAYHHDLLTALNLTALLYFMGLCMQAAYPPGPLPQRYWEILAQLPTHSPGFVALPSQEAGAPVTGAALHLPGYVSWLMSFAG